MDDQQEYQEVTITIRTSKTIQTITVPLATDIQIEAIYEEPTKLPDPWRLSEAYHDRQIGFSLAILCNSFTDEGYMYEYRREPVDE